MSAADLKGAESRRGLEKPHPRRPQRAGSGAEPQQEGGSGLHRLTAALGPTHSRAPRTPRLQGPASISSRGASLGGRSQQGWASPLGPASDSGAVLKAVSSAPLPTGEPSLSGAREPGPVGRRSAVQWTCAGHAGHCPPHLTPCVSCSAQGCIISLNPPRLFGLSDAESSGLLRVTVPSEQSQVSTVNGRVWPSPRSPPAGFLPLRTSD